MRDLMHTVFFCLLALLLLPFAALPVAAAAYTGIPDITRIDAFITSEMQADRIPGLSLGIVHDNQILHLRGFGVADPSGRTITPQTPFLVGSVTKSFTALAILQLVEAGKVDLDAPVQRYLPWFRVADHTASAQITVRNLLNHASGLPTGAGEAGLVHDTPEQFVRSLSTIALTAPVGKTFQYSNANYITLGLIIQTVSGKSYGRYIQQHILAPLEMQRTFVSEQEARQNGVAQGYHWLFGNPVPLNDPDLRLPALLPAGLLFSTAEDMSHYLIAQMNGGRYDNTAILSPAGITTMHAPAAPVNQLERGTSYGMGWFNGPVDGVPAVWHDGVTGAFHAYMIIEPQNHWGAILLMNAVNLLADITAYQHLQAGIAHLLAGQEPPPAGLSLSTLYLILEAILAVFSLNALWSIVRLRHWYRRFEQRPRHRIMRMSWRLFWGVIIPAGLLVIIPMEISLSWLQLLFYHPDLVYWLLAILALALLTGIIRTVLALLVLLRKKVETPVLVPTPTPSMT